MFQLPEEKSKPETDLKRYITMVYGQPGIGKTTLASQFDDPMFLMFEPGAKSLSVYKTEITKWKKFIEVVDVLVEQKRFQTVIIDTLTPAYDLCLQYIAEENNVSHPSEIPYKGWDMVKKEFYSQMRRIGLSKRGLVLLAHATEKEVEHWDGTARTMIAPNISKQAMQFVSESVDLLAYYYYAPNGKRKIRVQATDMVVAKNRIDGHFEGISKFSAGEDSKSAYKNFIDAFNNKQPVKKLSIVR